MTSRDVRYGRCGSLPMATRLPRKEPVSLRLRRLRVELLENRELLAGLTIESVDPSANTHTAPLDTDVSVIYDQEIDAASVSDATFVVHSMLSGRLLEPDNTLSVSGSTVTLNPAADFKPGEAVQPTATTGIRNSAGEPAAGSFVWRFRAVVPGGHGSFRESEHNLGDWGSHRVALGDVDGDGDLDALGYGELDIGKVWLNDGHGRFTDSEQRLGDSGSRDVALGDLDGDGDLDALGYGGLDRKVGRVWLNDDGGRFTDSEQRLGDWGGDCVGLANLDGDGDLDALGYGELDIGKVWLNDGRGRFTDSEQRLGDSGSQKVALGDLDGDGDLDAFVGNSYGSLCRSRAGSGLAQ